MKPFHCAQLRPSLGDTLRPFAISYTVQSPADENRIVSILSEDVRITRNF